MSERNDFGTRDFNNIALHRCAQFRFVLLCNPYPQGSLPRGAFDRPTDIRRGN